MKTIPFIKMHGCGNDYVYLDCFSHQIPDDIPELARRVSDRNRSIGSDGLVLMLPPRNSNATAWMRMFNSDGSEGALCGNALRCMALWLHQTGRAGIDFEVEMGSRSIGVHVVSSDIDRRRGEIRVQIGPPVILEPQANGRARFVQRISHEAFSLPRAGEASKPDISLVDDVKHVSMGNPHTILFVESLESTDFAVLGPFIEKHPLFPNRTNVEFVEVAGTSSATVRVWERGSGETLACGSGACAVAVAGIEGGLLKPDAQGAVQINMRGGILRVVWADNDEVFLEGPAEIAFEGVLNR